MTSRRFGPQTIAPLVRACAATSVPYVAIQVWPARYHVGWDTKQRRMYCVARDNVQAVRMMAVGTVRNLPPTVREILSADITTTTHHAEQVTIACITASGRRERRKGGGRGGSCMRVVR